MPRLSAASLKARIAALQKQLANAERSKVPALRKVRALMSKLGVTVADLSEPPTAKVSKSGRRRGRPKKAFTVQRKPATKIPVKYRDDHDNAWTGRGKTPKWILDAEKAGKNREDFRVVG